MDSCFWSYIHYMVCRSHSIIIMLYYNQSVSNISKVSKTCK